MGIYSLCNFHGRLWSAKIIHNYHSGPDSQDQLFTLSWLRKINSHEKIQVVDVYICIYMFLSSMMMIVYVTDDHAYLSIIT